jgi:Na+/H+ antiporter NhaD/arsenite permease-like protein
MKLREFCAAGIPPAPLVTPQHKLRLENKFRRLAFMLPKPFLRAAALFLALAALPNLAFAAAAGIVIAGIPFEFIIFAVTLLCVALFHHYTLYVALAGLAAITVYKLGFTDFKGVAGISGLIAHLFHEWVTIANLFLLLVGFALLSNHFEHSKVPKVLPRYLPDDWKGAFVLLVLVFVMSSFLDNIAAAIIGGTVAMSVFRKKVHIGYLAAIVAASNAGGSGSVVGDTTTTMMWIDGVSPLNVVDAYYAAVPALLFFAFFAAKQQHAYSPIVKDASERIHVDKVRLGIVAAILIAAIGANVMANLKFPELLAKIPVIGLAVWAVLLACVPLRAPDWKEIPSAAKGSIFLLSLVLIASMMPVEALPAASWKTAFGLGFISAVFDNIPLTALALKQGGYDWGVLAYCVGFGGSMIWFGSSAGVALTNLFPQGKSVGQWITQGWHVIVAYVIGFAIMMALSGWHPTAKGHAGAPTAAVPAVQK